MLVNSEVLSSRSNDSNKRQRTGFLFLKPGQVHRRDLPTHTGGLFISLEHIFIWKISTCAGGVMDLFLQNQSLPVVWPLVGGENAVQAVALQRVS